MSKVLYLINYIPKLLEAFMATMFETINLNK